MTHTSFTILPRSFYKRPSQELAQALLGKYLVRRLGETQLVGRIVEVEAYLPEGDAAAHGAIGYRERTKSLFGEGGHAYVHASRHHVLMDIVAGDVGISHSVLLRALEPVEGMEIMQRNRKSAVHIADGPARLCQALALSMDHDGADLTVEGEIFIADNAAPLEEIGISTRIGLGKARELPLRFFLQGNSHVSR